MVKERRHGIAPYSISTNFSAPLRRTVYSGSRRGNGARLFLRRALPLLLGTLINAAFPPSSALTQVVTEPQVRHAPTVHEWRAHPLFERHFISALPLLGSPEARVVGDLNCDARAEIASVNGSELRLDEMNDGSAIKVHLIEMPFRAVHPRLLLGNFDGEGCAELAIVLPELHEIWFVQFKGALRDPHFIRRPSPIPLLPVRYFARLVDGFLRHEILAVTEGNSSVNPVVTRISVDLEFRLHGQGTLASPEDPLTIIGVADPLGKGDQQVLLRYRQEELSRRRDSILPLWFFLALPGYPSQPPGTALVFAELSDRVCWGTTLVGDFNGDLREDMIVLPCSTQSSGVVPPWVLIAVGATAIEQQLQKDLRISPVALVGDLDGDGFADVIDPIPNGYAYLRSVPGRALSGVRVQCGDLVEVTAQDGTVAFLPPVGSTCQVESTTRTFLQPELPSVATLARHRTPVFLAYPRPDDRGAAVSFSEHQQGPFVCNGYIPGPYGRAKFGRQLICPEHYAMMEVDDSVLTTGACCRLPDKDMLTDITHWTSEKVCPADHIVTGSRLQSNEKLEIRCTRIRLDRYSLGPDLPGQYWGVGLSAPEKHAGLSRLEISPALRSAVGRLTSSKWDHDGCISVPPGGVLRGASDRECRRVRFAQFLGRHTDQVQQSALPLIPNCVRVGNPFDPLSGCHRVSAPDERAGQSRSTSR